MKHRLKQLCLSVLSILLSACSIFGVPSAKEARYKLIRKSGVFSIRQYDPVMLAQVKAQSTSQQNKSNNKFRLLFQYISGQNKRNQKIAMTSPVISQKNEKISMTTPVIMTQSPNEFSSMAFVLPRQYTIDNTPTPLNNNVKIISRPAIKMAVIRFSGSTNQAKIQTMKNKLLSWIKEQGLVPTGNDQLAVYDPPWTIPAFRRNEIQIPIK